MRFRSVLVLLLGIILWPVKVVRACYYAWRDITELYRPFELTDIKWDNRPEVKNGDLNTRAISEASHLYTRFGRCDRCSNEIWYRIIYTSAGIPIATLLCWRCAWELVQTSDNVQVINLTYQRRKWLDENTKEPPKG